MARRWLSRQLYARAAAVGVAALALFPAGSINASASNKPPSSAQCLSRVNDTPSKLVECVRTDDLWNHMKQFEAIAKANPSPADGHPSRNSGEPGYKASVDYVAAVMNAAGYDVTIQTYTFTYYAFTGIPKWSEASPVAQTFALTTDWNPGQSIGSANQCDAAAGGRHHHPLARGLDERLQLQ